MKWTEAAKKQLREIKADPRLQEDIKGLTDEEIIARWRFNDGGEGITTYNSEEEWRAARKAQKSLKEIEEV